MTRAVLLAASILLVAPAPASAQAPAQPSDRGRTFSVGGVFLAPAPAGSSTASLITPSGSRLTLFDVDSDYGIGYGAEAALGFRVSPTVAIEISGGWTWTTARSRISDDFESAPAVTITEKISRAAAEGAIVWSFADRGTTAFFLRGGGGWMRELAGGNSLVEDGIIGTGGVGVRRWFRGGGGTAGSRAVGLRLEGRVLVRTGGIEFGEATVRITPAAFGLLVFGF